MKPIPNTPKERGGLDLSAPKISLFRPFQGLVQSAQDRGRSLGSLTFQKVTQVCMYILGHAYNKNLHL